MTMPSQNAHMRNLRSLSPDWLSEKVTLRHYELRDAMEAPGQERAVVWTGVVRSSVHPYDQRWGQLREDAGIEFSPAEFFFGIRKSQNAPVVSSELGRGDELDWSGRTFTINQVDKTIWANGLALYVEAKAR